MIGFILSIIIFNIIAFITNRHLTKNQIVHIWAFTIAFQTCFDVFVDFKYHGYWYFTKAIDWWDLASTVVLVPPVNMMFLNWYPFKKSLSKQILYFIYWEVGIVAYELITLLPKPIGYFEYGWWTIWHSAAINPILLLILLMYYKWIFKLERQQSEV